MCDASEFLNGSRARARFLQVENSVETMYIISFELRRTFFAEHFDDPSLHGSSRVLSSLTLVSKSKVGIPHRKSKQVQERGLGIKQDHAIITV